MWETPKEAQPTCVKSCGHHKKETVHIDYYVKAKIDVLMEKYPDREWLGYLLGDKEENIVRDMIIPPQIATAGSVSNVETPSDVQIIGVIHSHHRLGVHDFSATDRDFINGNHDISILVWHNDGMMAQKRSKLPCGSVMFAKVNVLFFHSQLDEEAIDVLNQEANDNIKAQVVVNHTARGFRGPCRGAYEGEYGGEYEGDSGEVPIQPGFSNFGFPTDLCNPTNVSHGTREFFPGNKPGSRRDEKKNSGNSGRGWRVEPGKRIPRTLQEDDGQDGEELVSDLTNIIEADYRIIGVPVDEEPPHDVEAHFRKIEEDALRRLKLYKFK